MINFRRLFQFASALPVLLMLAACSAVPQGASVSNQEAAKIEAAFMAMTRSDNQACQYSMDARVDVVWDSIAHAGKIEGYLQAMAPSFIKFVGVNSFEQPLVIFVSDGKSFKYISVTEGKGYEGAVSSKTFQKYSPLGFHPQRSFYLLTGRVPPGPVEILETSKAKGLFGYWVLFRYRDGDTSRYHALFDPSTRRISQYMVANQMGEVLMTARYDQFQQRNSCFLPEVVFLSVSGQQGAVELRLSDWQMDARFTPRDFNVEVPKYFERTTVQ